MVISPAGGRAPALAGGRAAQEWRVWRLQGICRGALSLFPLSLWLSKASDYSHGSTERVPVCGGDCLALTLALTSSCRLVTEAFCWGCQGGVTACRYSPGEEGRGGEGTGRAAECSFRCRGGQGAPLSAASPSEHTSQTACRAQTGPLLTSSMHRVFSSPLHRHPKHAHTRQAGTVISRLLSPDFGLDQI